MFTVRGNLFSPNTVAIILLPDMILLLIIVGKGRCPLGGGSGQVSGLDLRSGSKRTACINISCPVRPKMAVVKRESFTLSQAKASLLSKSQLTCGVQVKGLNTFLPGSADKGFTNKEELC